MSLGTKLQSAYSKVYSKLGTQEGSLVFAAQSRTQPAEIGRPYQASTTTSVTINSGCSVQRVKARAVTGLGTLQAGDLIVRVPCNLLGEAQLAGSKLDYGGVRHGVLNWQPTEIYGGVPVQWEIHARKE